MFDPLTLLIVGAGALAFREANKKDYGLLTPAREERYRNLMEYCYSPEQLQGEAKLFESHGLKAQAAMLRRRAEWRGRPKELEASHNEVYEKALASKNVQGILTVADLFESWTATNKAATLRAHAQEVQTALLQEQANAVTASAESLRKANGKQDKQEAKAE